MVSPHRELVAARVAEVEAPPTRKLELVKCLRLHGTAVAGLKRGHVATTLDRHRILKVFVEIVGFWTPEYLAHRRETLRRFRHHRILIAVPEKCIRDGATIGANILVYKTALKLKPLMDALETMRMQHAPAT